MSSPTIPQRSPFAARAWKFEWLAWIAVWFVARGVLLLSFADVFGYGEEFEKACAGKAMLDGLGIPHYQLAYHYYEGGGFVISHLDALAFMVLGQSVLAVKFVALAFGAAILAASWKLCERIGGRNAARVFALLFVFAPESVQKNSLLTLGIHFHALLFVALVLDATAVLIIERDLRPRRWLWLGIAAGFGLFFSYQLVLTIAVVAFALCFALRRALLRRATLYGALGFVIGLAPLLWMASQAGREVFDIHGAEVVGGTAAAKLETLQKFFASVFGGRSALDMLALIALCASPLLGWFALRAPNSRVLRFGAWLVLAHIVVFLIAYLASGFTVGRVYHYFLLHRLTPLWWLAAVITALGSLAAWRTERAPLRIIAGAVVVALSICGAIDNYGMVRDGLASSLDGHPSYRWRGRVEILARTTGYAYPEYLHKISPHVAGTTADKLRVFLRFDEYGTTYQKASTLLPEAIAIALYGDGARSLEEIRRELADAGIQDSRSFYLGLGPMLRAQLGGDIAARVHAVEVHPPDVRDALVEAIGRFGLGNLVTEDRICKEVQQGIDAKLSGSYFRGLEHRAYDARGDLTVVHYFDMRTAPWMFNMNRPAYGCFAHVPWEQFGALHAQPYISPHLEHWMPRPWWFGGS